jgi:hypothetical protein
LISLKQSSFYILSVYPLFAVGLAYFVFPIIKPVVDKLKINTMGFMVFKQISILVILISIGLSFAQIGRVGRDKEMINDCRIVIAEVGKNTTINICSNLHPVWSLHGYFSRYGNVSLESNQNNICQYYLTSGDCVIENQGINYEIVQIETKAYKLYKLK